MPEVPLDQIPESRRIEGETEFARVRGVARRTVIRWVKDESPKATWARGSNGRHVFDALRSLSFPAFARWQKERGPEKPAASEQAPPERAGQMPLAFPQTEGQRALSELKARLYRINPTLYEGIEQGFLLIEPRINHKWSQEARTRTEYVNLVARRAGPHGVSAATIWRLFKNYSSGLAEAGMTAALEALRKNTSGPERGAGSRLDDSMKAIVTRLWLQGKTREQCYEGMMAELREKCRVLGATWVYDAPEGPQKPLYYAVVRFINAPPHGLGGERNPARHGREAVFNSAGYMDRHFEDEYAGETWCIDEWECDGMFYLENHRRTIVIPYIVSVIDERTTKVLGWRVSPSLDAETVLDLMEELARKEGPPRFLVSDRLGHYRRMLQHKKVLARKAELAERLAGPLEALGVTNRGPKREKNPRGNRIERMHGIYSDLARRDFGPSWREPLEGKHKMRRVDENVRRHLRDHCKLGISGPQLLSYERAKQIVASLDG